MSARTPVKAIRAFCLSCVGNSKQEVRLCPSVNCPLYEYRMRHRPKVEKSVATSSFDSKDEAEHVEPDDYSADEN